MKRTICVCLFRSLNTVYDGRCVVRASGAFELCHEVEPRRRYNQTIIFNRLRAGACKFAHIVAARSIRTTPPPKPPSRPRTDSGKCRKCRFPCLVRSTCHFTCSCIYFMHINVLYILWMARWLPFVPIADCVVSPVTRAYAPRKRICRHRAPESSRYFSYFKISNKFSKFEIIKVRLNFSLHSGWVTSCSFVRSVMLLLDFYFVASHSIHFMFIGKMSEKICASISIQHSHGLPAPFTLG